MDWVRIRFLGSCCAFALASFFVFRICGVAGLVIPARVTGNSMVPALMGDHIRAHCHECDFTFKVEQANGTTARMSCPNCLGTQVARIGYGRGDRVLIDKWKLRWKQPARGDLVALMDPDGEHRLVLKRVMGLPGEELEIRNGELWCNGEAIAPQMQFPINNDGFRRGGESRWRGLGDACWKQIAAGFIIDPGGNDDTPHWLAYQHVNGVAGMNKEEIYDEIPFNRTHGRSLNRCRHVFVTGCARLRGNGKFLLKCQIAHRSWVLEYDVGRQTVRMIDEHCTIRRAFTGDHFDFQIERAYNEIRFCIAGDVETRCRIEGEDFQRQVGVFCVGSVGLGVTLSDLVVQRGGYLTSDSPVPIQKPHWQLGPGEYFLLGDNSPVSRDSRHWGSVQESALVGFVRRY